VDAFDIERSERERERERREEIDGEQDAAADPTDNDSKAAVKCVS
jgi:hypothetical protein